MKLAYVLAFAMAVGHASAPAEAAEKLDLSFTSGLTYSEGDYGTDDKYRSFSIPLSVRLRTGQWRFSARMPYLFRNGPGAFIEDDGPIFDGDGIGRERRNGFGDLSFGVDYSFPDRIAGVEVDLGATLKLPTSKSSKGFGNGKTDVGFSAGFSIPRKQFTPFVELGYRLRGDRNDFPLRDTLSTSIGGRVPVGKMYASASYDYSRASTRFRNDAHSLSGSLTGRASRTLSISGFGSTGLSSGAADYSTGLLLTVRPNR